MGKWQSFVLLAGVVGLVLFAGVAPLSAQQPEDCPLRKHFDKNGDGQLDAKELGLLKQAAEAYNSKGKAPHPPKPVSTQHKTAPAAQYQKNTPAAYAQYLKAAQQANDPMKNLREGFARLSALYKETKQLDKLEFIQHKAIEAEIRFATAYTYILEGDYDRARGELMAVLKDPMDPREERMMCLGGQIDELRQHDLKLGIEENRVRAERNAVRERLEQLSREMRELEQAPHMTKEQPQKERHDRAPEHAEMGERLKNEIRELQEKGNGIREKMDGLRKALDSKQLKDEQAMKLKEHLGKLEEELVRLKEEGARRHEEFARMTGKAEGKKEPRGERDGIPPEMLEKAHQIKREIQELEQHGKELWAEVEKIGAALKDKKLGKDKAAELERRAGELKEKVGQIKNEIKMRKEKLERMEKEFRGGEKQPRQDKRRLVMISI
ncbi:MAG: hypothetical protein RDV41_08335 [Planctomycetota bacterium]|nr:hypothetical protein [Planctomycetota bacterium]